MLNEYSRKFTISSFEKPGDPDGYLPASHTCFFQLDLPKYSSAEVMIIIFHHILSLY